MDCLPVLGFFVWGDEWLDYECEKEGGGGQVETKLHGTDRFRVSTNQGDNFIDVGGLEWEMGITIDTYPHFHYIEIREKDNQIRMFCFKNKGVKKDLDLGFWSDAKVVFSVNKVGK